MAVDEIYILINKACDPPPTDGRNNNGYNDRYTSDIIDRSGIPQLDRDVDVTTDWTTFPVPSL